MQLNKTLRWFLFFGIFLVPFIPFIVTKTMFFPFITGKNFAFRILVEFLLAAWIILALRDPSVRPKKSALLWSLAALVGVLILAGAFGVNPSRSFWSNYERMEGILTHLHLFAYFLILGSMLTSEELWSRFFHTSIGASVLVCLYGILQIAGVFVINQGGVRVDATFGNATYLAVYLLFSLFLTALYAYRNWDRAWTRWAYGAVMFLQAAMLYETATRGAILGFLLGAFLVLLLLAAKDMRARRVAFGIGCAGLVLAGGFFLARNTAFVQKSPVLSRFANLSLNDETTQGRMIIWQMSFEAFLARPMLGWGGENYNIVFNTYYKPQLYGQEAWFDRSHNVLLDWLIAGGVFGLLSYLALFFFASRIVWRNSRFSVFEKSLLTGLLAAYFLQNLTVFDNLTSYLVFFSVLAYLHAMTASEPLFSRAPARLPGEDIFASLTVLGLVAAVYFFNVRGILASRALIQGISAQPGGISENMAYFEQAIGYHAFGTLEIREQLVQLAMEVAGAQNADQAARDAVIGPAVREIEAQVQETPNDARERLFAGTLFNRIGRFNDAIRELEAARALSPQKQAILFELVSSYLNTGNFPKALELAKEAYDLDPTFEDAQRTYGLVAIYAGDDALASTLLTPLAGPGPVDDDRFILAYASRHQFDKVVAIWQKRVAADPKNPRNHISLAASYLKAGDRASSIAEIQKAIDLDATFKAQGQYFIDQIKAGKTP